MPPAVAKASTLTVPGTSGVSPERKRANPLSELINTETLYVAELNTTIRRVTGAWSASRLPPPELDMVFRALEQIYRLNGEFVRSLYDIGPNPESPKGLGSLLMQWIDRMEQPYAKFFSVYFQGFDNWEPVTSNESLAKIFAALNKESPRDGSGKAASSSRPITDAWTLDSIFRLPLCRVRFYKRLYARLLKSTQPGRSDHRLLVGANERIDKLLALAKEREGMSVSGASRASMDNDRNTPKSKKDSPSGKAAADADSSFESVSGRKGRRPSTQDEIVPPAAAAAASAAAASAPSATQALPPSQSKPPPQTQPQTETQLPPHTQPHTQPQSQTLPQSQAQSQNQTALASRAPSQPAPLGAQPSFLAHTKPVPPPLAIQPEIHSAPLSTSPLTNFSHPSSASAQSSASSRQRPVDAEQNDASRSRAAIPPAPLSPKSHEDSPTLPPLETLSMEALQERIESGETVDVFTMRPKGCRLQINPPTLPFVRAMRITDTPRLRILERPGIPGVDIARGRVVLLSDLVLLGEQLSPGSYLPGPTTPRDVRLLFPPLAGKFVHAFDYGAPHEHAVRLSIMQRADIILYMTSEEKKQRYLASARACSAFAETGRSASVKGARPPLRAGNEQTSTSTPPPNSAPLHNAPTNPSVPPNEPPSGPSSSSQHVTFGARQAPATPAVPGQLVQSLSPSLQPGGLALSLSPSPSPSPLHAAGTPHAGPSTASSFVHSPGSGAPQLGMPPPLMSGASVASSPAQSPSQPNFPSVPPLNRGMSITSVDSFPRAPVRRDSEPGSRAESPATSLSRHTSNSSGDELAKPRVLPGGMSPLARSAVLEAASTNRRPSAPVASEAARQPLANRPANEDRRPSRSTSQPFLKSKAMLPSQMLSDGARDNQPEWLNEEHQPAPPAAVDKRRPSFVLCAQMRCKVFLKQSYAQWKSLGNGRLRMYHLQPSGENQLVVENEKKKILLSTIVLTDAVERVGRTGIAVELSEDNHRSGIVYMLHMRSEESALGLFEQLLDGSHRSVSAMSRSATALSTRTN
ncbi:hypothetical protein MCUN1_003409 [Malassezia cuniculi]|uniref:DH domain-containing protein n=1 Tax=Malassezia cuniculi TaxID=948313 RepID=A0AAF0JD41_9BASI|nr:hypothetical protein MCUN1_003409 [Malassezia cuniculi]